MNTKKLNKLLARHDSLLKVITSLNQSKHSNSNFLKANINKFENEHKNVLAQIEQRLLSEETRLEDLSKNSRWSELAFGRNIQTIERTFNQEGNWLTTFEELEKDGSLLDRYNAQVVDLLSKEDQKKEEKIVGQLRLLEESFKEVNKKDE